MCGSSSGVPYSHPTATSPVEDQGGVRLALRDQPVLQVTVASGLCRFSGNAG